MRRPLLIALVFVVGGSAAWAAGVVDDALRRTASEVFCRVAHVGPNKDLKPVPNTDDYLLPHFPGALVDFWIATREDVNPQAFGKSHARMSNAYWRELTGTPLDTNPKTRRVELHPKALSWAAKALAPRPEDRICGTTAQVVYDGAYKNRARYALRLLERLEQDAAFMAVDSWRDVASFSVERVRGNLAETRLESACSAADAALGRDLRTMLNDKQALIARYPSMRHHTRATFCAFFMRRQADGSLPAVAATFRELMTAFDPSFAQR